MMPDEPEAEGKWQAQPKIGLPASFNHLLAADLGLVSGVTHGLVHARALVPALDAWIGDDKNAAKVCINANALEPTIHHLQNSSQLSCLAGSSGSRAL